MITVSSPPPKAARYTCHVCGLTAPAPIVVQVPRAYDTTHGRCSNRTACDQRARRNAARKKANEVPA